MRQREIHYKARQHRDRFGQPDRQEQNFGRDQKRRGVREPSGDAGENEREVRAPFQPAAGFAANVIDEFIM